MYVKVRILESNEMGELKRLASYRNQLAEGFYSMVCYDGEAETVRDANRVIIEETMFVVRYIHDLGI